MQLIGSRLTVRPVSPDDEREFLSAARAGEEFHRPYAFLPLTEEEFAAYLDRFDRIQAHGFVLRLTGSGELVGYINVSQIVRGSYQRGTLGYGVFPPHHRRGYMTEGLRLVIRHAFETLSLHRLEAEIQPENKPSLRLVELLGFEREGLARGLIRIEGEWRDHERWTLRHDV
ncbi:GNAT family N-acetyltransferase [Actinocorallia sp. B10E7]|uniref:GNAT family N-acetyltransferase n=1 Tax=Actinocorallia sp. B10E7 TaxID=3153558 RepID=UPI00325CA8E5